MVLLLMILGVGLVAAAAWFLVRAAALARLQMQSHLAHVQGYGAEAVVGEVEGEAAEESGRPLERLAIGVGTFAATNLPGLPRLDRNDLSAAGIYSTAPEAIDGYRWLAGVAVATVVLLYAVALTGTLPPLAVPIAAMTALIGWDVPSLIIRRRGRSRLEAIDKQLPDLIDLLVASVEAGLGVGASLALLAERFDGPLGQELHLLLQQQRLGTSSPAALTALSERANTPGVRAFTRTLIRADALGGSVGSVLRNLATDSRRRRRQEANERAAKVPIKLLFPLILFIFPSLFVVLLYPAAYTIARQFGS